MRNIRSRLTSSSFMFASPWILASAAGLLIFIVVAFAMQNLRLEKRLMTNAMVQKAATFMRVTLSGARSSYIADVRKGFWNASSWQEHVQQVIEHLGEDSHVSYIALVDDNNVIIAHSDKASIDSQFEREISKAVSRNALGDPPLMAHHIVNIKGMGRVFEAIQSFSARPNFPMIPLLEMKREFFQKNRGRQYGRGRPAHGPPFTSSEQVLVIGLDMAEYDQTLVSFRLQIVMLSLAMLLVGLGGWLSLSAVQGYRVSQKTLQDIQAFTGLLVASLPVGIIATDERGKIASWNQSAEKILGIPEKSGVGRKPQETLPVQLAELFVKADNKKLPNTNETGEEEISLHLGEHEVVLLAQVITIYDRASRFVGKVLLLSDVSELKSLEKRMVENERLAAIGRMAGGVAHEVRNPLSSIKGLALLLKNKFPMESKEHNTADLLIQETDRMNRTITEMLSFTRPASLDLGPVEINTLLKRCLQLLSVETKENNIAVKLDVAPELNRVLADPDRLNQVFMNILLNAIQAIQNGGTLTVKAKNDEATGQVRVEFLDSGQGMKRETLAQVFYPYFTTKPQGTGIGLAISQKIIADHHGSIAIESEVGKGTQVTLKLPACGQGEAQQS